MKSGAAPAFNQPVWRSFSSLSAVEAQVVVERFAPISFELHVTCRPGQTSFAVAGADADHRWHWAVFNLSGERMDDGVESSLPEAQAIALEALLLWIHRCEGRHACQCPAIAGLRPHCVA